MMRPDIISPLRLKPGDEIRVLALSRSIGGVLRQAGITETDIESAVHALESIGLKVSFGRHVRECNEHLTASIEHRIEDLLEAFAAPSIKGILAVTGGIGAIQLLDRLDWGLIKANPKCLCGYSDIAYFSNSVLARAGLVTYYGPNFTSFMMRKGGEYTLRNFRQCLFEDAPISLLPAEMWSDDAWHKDQENRTFLPNEGFWAIQDGEGQGNIVGGSAWCLNMLQGTSLFPALEDTILFLEQPGEGKATLMNLDSSLRALALQPTFSGVHGIVIGRYPRNCGVNPAALAALLRDIPHVNCLPVAANADFGHTTPVFTLPVGGRCNMLVQNNQVRLRIVEH